MDSSDPAVRTRLTDLAGTGTPPRAPAGRTAEAGAPGTGPGDGPGRDPGGDLRARAVASALTAYTAAHGHPLEHRTHRGGPWRWATAHRTVLVAVAALALVVGAVVVVRLAGEPPHTLVPVAAPAATDATTDSTAPTPTGAVPPEGPPAGTEDGAPTGAAAPDVVAPATLLVHVVGQVVDPGLVELPAGSRVADAVEAAGGVTTDADVDGVNLARPVVDGEQVVVPAPGEGEVVAAPGAAAGEQGGAVDLNLADAAALDALPGIGPVLAERIVDWRTEHGRFTSVEELTEVSGIGPAMLERLRDRVRVG